MCTTTSATLTVSTTICCRPMAPHHHTIDVYLKLTNLLNSLQRHNPPLYQNAHAKQSHLHMTRTWHAKVPQHNPSLNYEKTSQWNQYHNKQQKQLQPTTQSNTSIWGRKWLRRDHHFTEKQVNEKHITTTETITRGQNTIKDNPKPGQFKTNREPEQIHPCEHNEVQN